MSSTDAIKLQELMLLVDERMNTARVAGTADKSKSEVYYKISEYEQDLKSMATQGKEEAREFTRNRICFILAELKELIHRDNIDDILRQYPVNYYKNIYSGDEEYPRKPIDEEIEEYFQKYSVNQYDSFDRKLQKLAQICYQELYGYSILDELVFESDFNEVACNRYDYIWIQYKGIKRRIPNPQFKFSSEEYYSRIVENRLAASSREEMNAGEPIIYATLLNGFRVTAARPPLSRYFIVSIRLFVYKTVSQGKKNNFFGRKSIQELSRGNSKKVTSRGDKIYDVLELLIRKGRRNIAIIGEQGAGKTTAADELVIKNLDDDLSIGLAENIHELNISGKYPEKNVIEFQYGKDFTPAQILEMFFRFNRDIIILGEVRSHLEAFEMIKAMVRQARGSLFTFHSSGVRRMIHDLRQLLMQTGYYTDYREAQFDIADAVDLVLHVKLDRDTGRRYIAKVSEIVALEAEMSYAVRDLFSYERERDKYLVNREGVSSPMIESCLEYEMNRAEAEQLKVLFVIGEGEEGLYEYM